MSLLPMYEDRKIWVISEKFGYAFLWDEDSGDVQVYRVTGGSNVGDEALRIVCKCDSFTLDDDQDYNQFEYQVRDYLRHVPCANCKASLDVCLRENICNGPH